MFKTQQVFTVLLLFVYSCSARSGFLLNLPTLLQSGGSETFCLTLHDVNSELDLQVVLQDEADEQVYLIQTQTFAAGHDGCFDLNIPSNITSRSVKILVEGRSQDGYTFQKNDTVDIGSSPHMTFIQTDKPIYKPGQTVHFRIMTLKPDLKPIVEDISSVCVRDPTGVRVMQWKDVSSQHGMVSLSLPLSSEPTLGAWVIEADIEGERESQYFEVKEYVLPKYEITVTPPSFVLVNAMNISAEICAKYTYGEPVHGHMTVRACIKQPYFSAKSPPCYTVEETLNGCSNVIINTGEMQINSMRYSLYRAKLRIEATVTELATGNMMNGTGEAKITRNMFKLDLESNSPTYYKPGLPYHGLGLITHPDGTPAADEIIMLRYSTWAHRGAIQQETVYHNFTSDSEGRFPFTIPNINTNTSFSIRASMPAYTDFDYSLDIRMPVVPGATLYLKPWYSPTDSFLQIEPFSDPNSCGNNLQINVLYTTHLQTTYKFHYQVMSRGNIVHTGHRRHHFKRHDVELEDDEWQPEPETDYYVDTEYTYEYGNSALSECQRQKNEAELNMMPGRFVPRCRDDGSFHEVQCHGSTGHCWCANHLGDEIAGTRLEFEQPVCDIVDNSLSIHTSMVTLDIPIQASMSPLARLLVFYVNENGETIADSKEINMPSCLENQVTLSIGDGIGRKMPGEAADIVISADSESICGLGVVDKSVQLLGGDNTLTLSKVFDNLEQYDLNENRWRPDTYCQDQFTDDDFPQPPWEPVPIDPIGPPGPVGLPGPPPPAGPTGPMSSSSRARRSFMPYGRAYSNFYDSSKAFKLNGMLSLSDTDIDTRPCERDDYYPGIVMYSEPVEMVGLPGPGGPGGVVPRRGSDRQPRPVANSHSQSKTLVSIRNYFPETWLWDLHIVEPSESSVIVPITLPHSLTTWMGSAICLNSMSGLGLSSADVTVFQPFFASFNLPYSVVRGESVPISVTVFNYLTECMVVKLTLDTADWFQMTSGDQEIRLCVCGGLSVTYKFYIRPSAIGNNNITVHAESIDDAHVCAVYGHKVSNQYGVTDAITRTVLVEAEGVESGYSVGSFVCPDTDGHSETMNLELPSNLVAESARGYFTVIGDVMGPALSGLDKLLRLPTGCGEQNMLKFAPNIYVMQYLEGSHQVNDDIESKALGYMRTGYQRELRYRHSDGSYSAFGDNDDEGSTWLTAFVLQSFSQAQEFINIDEVDLAYSMEWLKDQQMENGCIRQRGRVLHKAMKGGVAGSENPATLTAYVLASLLQAGEQNNSTSVQNALLCLANNNSSDTYTLALTAYAYSLYDNTGDLFIEALEHLDELVIMESGTKHWSTGNTPPVGSPSVHHQAPSADVELTSYVLLSKLKAGGSDVISEGLPIVRWLTQQRNGDGGFASTQDTVVGLKALAAYASLVYSDDVAVEVSVQGTNIDDTVSVNDENSLLQVKIPLTVPNSLSVLVSGQGCALVQANVLYNILTEPNPTLPHFQIDIRTRLGGKNDCKVRVIGICSSYNNAEPTNMAVIAVKMVSGWIPAKDSLKALHNDATLDLKRFEVDKNWVHFYFDELNNRMTCLDFVVTQDIEVQNTKPGIVHVYDYYDKDISHEKEYQIDELCTHP